MSPIAIDEAEKIATEFVQKKRSDATKIVVTEVTEIDPNRTRVSGKYIEKGIPASYPWEVKIRASDKTVYEYKIS